MSDYEIRQQAGAETGILNNVIHFKNIGRFTLKFYDETMWTHRASGNIIDARIFVQQMTEDNGQKLYMLSFYTQNLDQPIKDAFREFRKKYNLDVLEWDSILKVADFLQKHLDEIDALFGGAPQANTITKNARIAKRLVTLAKSILAAEIKPAHVMFDKDDVDKIQSAADENSLEADFNVDGDGMAATLSNGVTIAVRLTGDGYEYTVSGAEGDDEEGPSVFQTIDEAIEAALDE